MQEQLPSGIPTEQAYRRLIGSEQFRKLEQFSNEFLSFHRKELGRYANKWVADPLHQWSRQWEYPYVLSRIEPLAGNREALRILDAGSGVTFFPYLIQSQYPSSQLYCTDYDRGLDVVYQQIGALTKANVHFTCGNLQKLSYEDNWFDIIYCISVLEHTRDYEQIIEEFCRVLRPGGRLIITFDVSLDGTRDISLQQADGLVQALAGSFHVLEAPVSQLSAAVSASGVFTTLTAKNINPASLPWRLPPFVYQAKLLLTGKGIPSWPPPLTVFCMTLEKPAA